MDSRAHRITSQSRPKLTGLVVDLSHRFRHLKKAVALCMAVAVLPNSGVAQAVCLPIERIDVAGVTQFSAQDASAWVDDYQGRCLAVSEFDEILERITTAYIEAGFILSRAYLPEQDLSDGQLDLSVVEGELAKIRINGQEQPSWSANLFPGQIGKPVNLRNVEQGLDAIQDMPRWSAEMAFESGEKAGETVLDITAVTSKKTQLKFTSNNQGTDESGQWITGLSLDSSNLFGRNETWEIGGTRSLSPGPISFHYDGDINRSGYLRLKFPYGRNTFKISRSWSDYRLTIPGTISPIPTHGYTHGQAFQWKRQTYRDQTNKQNITVDLDVSTNANFIQGTYINASSRRLATLKLTYGDEGPAFGGQLTRSFSFDFGLPNFGAEHSSNQPVGAPNAQYKRIVVVYDFEKPLTFWGQKVNWASTFKAQFSTDRLYGGQQFSIGGLSTVRGSRIALARGSSGILWRNELALPLNNQAHPIFGRFKAYWGVDVGSVTPQSDLQVVGGAALGHAIGLSATDGQMDFDFSYQRILKTSSHLQKPDAEWMISIGFKV